MSDLIEPNAPSNAPEFSVSELSGAIKRVIEGEFSHVRIRAEVGRLSMPRSGHLYLDLKDDKSVISAVIWKGVVARLQTRPEEGLEVIAVGRISTFGGQSKYQLIIEDIRPAGVGALMAMLERRKKQLAAEGLFDDGRKKPIPYLPDVIGVVTSPSGAVIRDILHRLRDRFPRRVVIWPVAVQGDKCAPEVSRAIAGFNAMPKGGAIPRPDLIIVARGGGSLEDLWGFNEESVARAAAASDIPLISAVGHETDTTLIDYVSDWRAPTPTAAAERAVPVRRDLAVELMRRGERLETSLNGALTQRKRRLLDVARAMGRPEALITNPRQRFDFIGDRLPMALRGFAGQLRAWLDRSAGQLNPRFLTDNLRAHHRSLDNWHARLAPALDRAIGARRDHLRARTDRLHVTPLAQRTAQGVRDISALAQRMERSYAQTLRDRHQRLVALDRLRETLGYKATLERGYAVVRIGGDVITTQAGAAQAAGSVEIEFADGRHSLPRDGSAVAAPTSSQTPPISPTPKTPRKKAPPSDDGQGSLF